MENSSNSDPITVMSTVLTQDSPQCDPAEVVQVVVVHLDLFTCGTCGEQVTDILEYLLHKSFHEMSLLHTCELCKKVYKSQEEVLHHYHKEHQLSHLLLSVLTDHSTPEALQTDTGHEPEPISLFQKTGVRTVEYKNSTGDNGQLIIKLLDSQDLKNPVNESDYSNATRVKSRMLLKNAKRMSTNARKLAGADSGSSKRGSYKPSILQRISASLGESKITPQKSITENQVTENRPGNFKDRRKPSTALRVDGDENSVEIPSTEPLLTNPNFEDETDTGKDCTINIFDNIVEEIPFPLPVKNPGSGARSSKSSTCKGRRSTTTHTSEKKRAKPRKVERQDLPGVYPCTQCGKSFARLRYLRKHAHVHSRDKKYVCDECGKFFKCKGYLAVHKKTHSGKERVFKCNQCDFTSKINQAIHAHRQVHSQGSVLCDICGFAYHDKSSLTKHLRVHDPKRPYACTFPQCSWRFKTEVMCKAHIRAHTTEGKFQCSYCGYVFRQKHHLQRHVANKHSDKIKQEEADGDNEIVQHSQETVDYFPTTGNTDCDLDIDHQTLKKHLVVIQSDIDYASLMAQHLDGEDITQITDVIEEVLIP